MSPHRRTGGQHVVDALLQHGIDHVFAVPGESFLPILDALHDVSSSIRLVICRHEAGAAAMAEAYGKLTGRPGVCLATRGPGACHASVGVHTARQDSTPMLLLVGQVSRTTRDREAFQEIDLKAMFTPVAKLALQVDLPERLPEYMARACHAAVAGRAGPVVLALPEDVLAAAAEAPPVSARGPAPRPFPGAGDLQVLADHLTGAERPLLLVGGGGWTAEAVADITACAERQALPVAASFRAQDRFDNRHAHYVGHVGLAVDPGLADAVRASDLLLAVGPRLGDATTGGYSVVKAPRPDQRLVHVLPEAEELGRVYQPDLSICAAAGTFAAAFRRMAPSGTERRAGWLAGLRAGYERFRAPPSSAASIDLGHIIAHLDAVLPEDAIVANGAGNFSIWVHRFFRYRHFPSQLAPTGGAMGYGVPAAIAAKLLHPERTVIVFAGDGDFLMCGQELATACQYRANIVIIVVNNGQYGTIRAHQARCYPGRPIGTSLLNPDFAAYAAAFGAYGEVVDRTIDFTAAFARACQAGTPALLEVKLEPSLLTPDRRLNEDE